jgi:hypothetical protein
MWLTQRSCLKVAGILLLSTLLLDPFPKQGRAEALPSGTALPVEFLSTLMAGKAKVGDSVHAKTLQTITLPNKQILAKGTLLTGHVIESRPFAFDPKPYAEQAPSILTIRFDFISGGAQANNIVVRALANAEEAYHSSSPDYLDDMDPAPTVHLIGGDAFSPVGKLVFSPEGTVVGYNSRQGIHARLLANLYVGSHSTFRCDAGTEEQSMAIFSASACGLYGFDYSTYLENLTGKEEGAFRLASRRYTVEIQKGSAALLEVE